MITGLVTFHGKGSNHNQDYRIKTNHILKQLLADNFAPLASIPHDTKEVYQNNGIGLIQQSVTIHSPQNIAQCEHTGQVCISWSRLNDSDALVRNLGTTHVNQGNDASLILNSYQRWQDDCPEHIQGDFAFAIYDPKRQIILLARDRLGVKPLYYNDGQPCFLFSSNPAAIAKLDEVDNQVSTDWIAQYLFKHNTNNELTAFANIKKLPAGHTLLLSTHSSQATPQIRQYWKLEDLLIPHPSDTHSHNTVDMYRERFDNAVCRRVNNTQRLGVELSGGLDSSSIMVSLMEQLPNADVHCFSRAYFSLEKEPLEALYDQYPNTTNHLWDNPVSNPHDYQQDLNRYITLFGLPDEHALAIGCSDFLKVAKKNEVKTMLSGFGGDEFSSAMAADTTLQFASQRRYVALYSRLNGNPVKRLTQILKLVLKKPKNQHYQPAMLQMDHPALVLMKQQQNDNLQRLNNETNHNRRLIQQWRLSGVLRLESHTLAASAQGISFHWPFLDEDLMACYFASPITERLGAGSQKRWLHRRAFKKRLPNTIVNKNNKNIGSLVNSNTPYDLVMQRLPNNISLHPQLQALVDEDAFKQFLTKPTASQKESPNYYYTSKSIYSVNLWLNHYF